MNPQDLFKTNFCKFAMAFIVVLLGSTSIARADTFTYTYTGANFAIFVSPYTGSNGVDGTIVLSSALPSNSFLTDQSALVVSYNFTDGVQTLTNLNSTLQDFDVATNGGTIVQWEFSAVNGTQTIVIISEFLLTGDFGGSTVSGEPHGSTFAVGSWSGPVVSTTGVPEPGTLSMTFSGLVGLGLLVGLKRCRASHLATQA